MFREIAEYSRFVATLEHIITKVKSQLLKHNSYLLHGHASSEHGGDGEVSAVSWVTGGHHVLGVKHLLDELGHCQCAVLLAAARRQWSKAWHEEVKSREWNHVDRQLAQISVQLTTLQQRFNQQQQPFCLGQLSLLTIPPRPRTKVS